MTKKQLYFLIVLLCFAVTYGIQRYMVYLPYGEENYHSDSLTEKAFLSCNSPFDLGVKDTKPDEAILYWEDTSGTAWEYLVQSTSDPFPTGVGASSTAKEVTVTKDHNGSNLLPNKEYEFYVRADCGTDGMSSWTGPFVFKTECIPDAVIPFWEGFNTDSSSSYCWTIVDNNNDATIPTGDNIWRLHTSTPYEGNRTMYFQGVQTDASKIPHDDWLISPAFTLDAAKVYQLRYFYKTHNSYAADFKVLLSKDGTALSDFKTELLTKKNYKNTVWEDETILIGGINGEVNIAWHITTAANRSYMFLDNVTLVEIDCAYPVDLNTKNEKANQVTIVWEDNFNTDWEYVVQKEGEGAPGAAGTASATNEVTVTQDNSGANLQPDTAYEFYVRAKCADGFSDWIGPFVFKTACAVFSTPFAEGFNIGSPTLDCWTIVDANEDGNAPQNIFFQQEISYPFAYEGDGAMSFLATINTSHDDWLISPTIALTGGIYSISYYYRVQNAALDPINEFEVLLSENGTDLNEFTTVLLPKKEYFNSYYTKETIYVQGITGTINIAWHITSQAKTVMRFDWVTIEAVDCMGIEGEIAVSEVKTNEATFSWQDNTNTQWEYYVQTASGTLPPTPPPSTSLGTNTSNKGVTVLQTTAGANLQPDTEYEFWVRSRCTNGTGDWKSVSFKTPCPIQPLPFWEGFNSNSLTASCWTILDNGDADPQNLNEWSIVSAGGYEGDGLARLLKEITVPILENDDWLISPTFTFNPAKYYRLKYHYNIPGNQTNSFEVLLSTQGTDPVHFTHSLVTKEDHIIDNMGWKEKRMVFSGIAGEANIAWHIDTDGQVNINIDNVFLEEMDCPEPYDLQTRDEKEDSAVITWSIDAGTQWEYIVQKEGLLAPSGNGIVSAQTAVTVTTDKDGQPLESNTTYEFYVRTVCDKGEYSIWMGPYVFRTACKVFDTPFWEGFNVDSPNLDCWTIVNADGKLDPRFPYQYIWSRKISVMYEGTSSMRFWGGNTGNDDWLISPAIKLETGKTYRLKYHYRTMMEGGLNSSLPNDNSNSEFEVLLSDSGRNINQFTTTVVPKKMHHPGEYWQEEHVFIAGVNGEVNLAWHATDACVILYIDNIFVEEVEGCPEPLLSTLGAKDEQSNSATIFWDDDFGATTWEYYVQKAGEPVPSGSGTLTTSKENTVTKEQSGKTLNLNTAYEFYVRTDCGNGEYSIWTGPYRFATPCDVYPTPFWEGFNTDSPSFDCWTIERIINTRSWITGPYQTYEGDQLMQIAAGPGQSLDDWLISPKIKMTAGRYVLKYHYKIDLGTPFTEGKLEVLLSTDNTGLDTFTQTLAPAAGYYNLDWKEKVVFFNATAAEANLAWRMKTEKPNLPRAYAGIQIDNVSLKKVETCPEPYYVEVTNQTSNSIAIAWQQEGGITNWEVTVVNYGEDETAVPVQTVNVTGTPNTTITGLDEGKAYTIYVRAKCTDDNANSDWSTPLNTGTRSSNDDCDGAINVPVNLGNTCDQVTKASLIAATQSAVPAPACFPGDFKDIWFEFTATAEVHVLGLQGGRTDRFNFTYLEGALYGQSCNAMTTELDCFTLRRDHGGVDIVWLKDLVPGQKYYIRLARYIVNDDLYDGLYDDDVFDFDLCITTPAYLAVSPQDEDYTLEELVKDVLIRSNCDLTSNISYQNADGNPQAMAYQTIGYFNKNGADFPFEEGIVLSTREVKYIPGPFVGIKGFVPPFEWKGDKDVTDVLDKIGERLTEGLNKDKLRTTQLEFDFIPMQDSISFEYLLASDQYTSYCLSYCDSSTIFAAYLTDTTTGERQNLAEIPDTDIPIATTTIRDINKAGLTDKMIAESNCGISSYPEFYWKSYIKTGTYNLPLDYDWYVHGGRHRPAEAPFDYPGSTLALPSKKAAVVAGRKYHLKFLIIDQCLINFNDNTAHSSAVFVNAESFKAGNITLGMDWLIETNNALCDNQTGVLHSQTDVSDLIEKEYAWYKDGVLIPGADTPDLEVSEAGEYKVVMKLTELNCEFTDTIVVEVYPAISETVHQAEPIEVCRYALQDMRVNLAQVETGMLHNVDTEIYSIEGYYNTVEEAEAAENAITDAANYSIGKEPQAQTVYIRVENTATGCYEVFELHIQPEEGAVPEQLENITVCSEYEFPATASHQYYYTQPGGVGKAYKGGDVLAEPGEHTIYLLQVNSDEGCYEETAYQVNITTPVTADIFEDQTLSCEYYELQPLSEHNRYYTEPEGQGTELYAGMQIFHKQTVYVYASSEDDLCTDESSFTIDYEDCPIPRGISPNGDGLNDVFDLTPHGVESIKIYNRWGTEVYSHGEGYTTQWHGQNKSGKQLPDGTYYYVIQAHGKIRTGWVQINK